MFSDPWLFAQPIFYPDSNNPPIEVSGNLTPRLDRRCLPVQYIPHSIQYGLVLGRPATKVSACGSESVGIV